MDRWKKQLKGKKSPQAAFLGNGNIGVDKKELEKLRRELARVKEERKILKEVRVVFCDRRDDKYVCQGVRI